MGKKIGKEKRYEKWQTKLTWKTFPLKNRNAG